MAMHPLLAAYRSARYTVSTPAGAVALAIGTTPPPLLADLPAAVWTILGAANPGSWPAQSATNAARHRELRAMVAWLGARSLAACNAAPDGSWTEDALAVALPPAHVDGLARHFGQAATVVVAAGTPVRLRCLRCDWRTADPPSRMDGDFVDWIA